VIDIRPAGPGDLDELVRLNSASVPAVSAADPQRMAQLVDLSALAWVVDGTDDRLDGFVLLFEPGSTYDSLNYAWFSERYERFLYVDRIVVDDARRSAGLGAALYGAVIAEAARRNAERVTAEVNLEPPNPGSSRFHRRMGFEPVGVQELGPGYRVEMLACEVE
jgi:predicted GNAT superfamily acetyltransferase